MSKIRHIAYRAVDVEAFADFFVRGLGMEIVQRRPGGVIDLSDGVLNISVLPVATPLSEGEPGHGIAHIGFTVEDEDQAKQRLEAAGGRELKTIRTDGANYEIKFSGPEGIVIDLGHWAGTAPVQEAGSTPAR